MAINIGEELAYWYVRVNGFFLLEDFVLQKTVLAEGEDGTETRHNADADLLAIRPQYVFETIDNKPIEWDDFWTRLPDSEQQDATPLRQNQDDPMRVTGWTGNVALIAQSKMGKIDSLEAFSTNRLDLCLKRLGIARRGTQEFGQALLSLSFNSYAVVGRDDEDGWLIRKVLFAPDDPPRKFRHESYSHLRISPTEIIRSLKSRFKEYGGKAGAWEYFPSFVMQLLALERSEKIILCDQQHIND